MSALQVHLDDSIFSTPEVEFRPESGRLEAWDNSADWEGQTVLACWKPSGWEDVDGRPLPEPIVRHRDGNLIAVIAQNEETGQEIELDLAPAYVFAGAHGSEQVALCREDRYQVALGKGGTWRLDGGWSTRVVLSATSERASASRKLEAGPRGRLSAIAS